MRYLFKCAVLVILVSPISKADILLDELLLCAKNNNDLVGLVCFDKLAEKANKGSSDQQVTATEPSELADNLVIPAQQILATDNVPINTSQQQADFGLVKKQRSEDLVTQIQATIVKVRKGPYNYQIVTLDNGQVWRQTDGSGVKFSNGHRVIIKQGALGSFFIGKEDTSRRVRAKRVK